MPASVASGEELRATGIEAPKVSFHAGDEQFYPGPSAVPFRSTCDEWPPFMRRLMQEKQIDGIFLFGNYRRLHREAIVGAKERRAAVWVFEEGYRRPEPLSRRFDTPWSASTKRTVTSIDGCLGGPPASASAGFRGCI